MTETEAAEAVEAALVAAGVRVATRAADVTPPCAFLRWQGDQPGAGTLDGQYPLIVAVHWVPVRGTQDLYADTAAADTIVAALAPVGVLGDGAPATVTVNEQTSWPCSRWLLTVT